MTLLQPGGFYGALSIFSGLILVFIAIWTYQYRDENGAKSFIGIMLSMSGWCIFNGANLLATTHFWKIVFLHATFISVFSIPPLWVVFSLQFTNNRQWWTSKLKAFTLGGAAFFMLLSATNQLHFLYMSPRPLVTEPFLMLESQSLTFDKPFYILSYVYAYSLVIASNVLIARLGLSSGKLHKDQIYMLVVGMCIPMLAGAVTALGLSPIEHFDLVPYAVGIWGIVLAYVFHRHRLFDITPIARERVIRRLDDAMIVIDRKGRVTDYNDAAEPMFLQTPDGKLLSEVAPDSLLAALAKVGVSVADYGDEIAASDGAGVVDENANNIPISVNGSERIYNIRLSTINQGASGVAAKAILMRDITELNEKKRELERQNERLDDFAGILAHDLRSPLTVAETFGYHAQKTGEDEHFEKMHNAHDRMDEMIDDILTLARQGNESVNLKPVDLKEMVQESWSLVDTHDGELIVETDQTIQADPSQLSNLFQNLIRNAFEHVGQETTVYVGDLVDDDGFFVADDGPGIPEDKHDEVFEYGYTTNTDGTGFGLSIVKESAESHGWDISLADDSEYGAKFEVRF
jgi:signal transduction histidine kinase